MATLFISQGHGGADAGSMGADDHSEKMRIRKLVPLIEERVEKAGHRVIVKNEKNANGSWAFTSASGDVKFSIHFNAFNEKARGVECWYKKSSMKSKAATMSKKVAKAMGIDNRGAKYTDSLRMMNIGFDLLLEVCFHDNKKDLNAYQEHKKEVAKAIADVLIDMLGGKKNTTNKKEPSADKNTNNKLTVDGSWGKDCTKKTQKIFKTTQDGIISNQPSGNRKYLPNASSASWQFEIAGYSSGSTLIKAIQRYLGIDDDGWCGKGTIKAMQKFLKNKGYYTGELDGSMGPSSVKAWQKYINSRL